MDFEGNPPHNRAMVESARKRARHVKGRGARSGGNGHPNGHTPLVTPASAVSRPPRKVTPHGLRIAAIDIGTNSLHMVIVEVTDTLAFKILASDRDLTQLGSAALLHHRL